MPSSLPTRELVEIAKALETFEACPSIAKTGTGSRREGEQFESLVADFWEALGDYFENKGAQTEKILLPNQSNRRWTRLRRGARSIFMPTVTGRGGPQHSPPAGWLDLNFLVEDLIANYPGRNDAIAKYAPESGPYAGEHYPEMYTKTKTRFDDTIVLEEDGVLHEKMLLEYKTAKSSNGTSLDGNAHERLAFQIMQYLEVATRFPHCSLSVLANGAFARYRNKYHVSFRVQADRLSAFRWFSMKHYCTQAEYALLANRFTDWLFEGQA